MLMLYSLGIMSQGSLLLSPSFLYCSNTHFLKVDSIVIIFIPIV